MSLWNVLDAFGVKQERRSFWEHAKLFCSPFRNKDPSITMEGSLVPATTYKGDQVGNAKVATLIAAAKSDPKSLPQL